MLKCPKPGCDGGLIWQSDWDSDDLDEPAIFSAWYCHACETDVTFKEKLEAEEE